MTTSENSDHAAAKRAARERWKRARAEIATPVTAAALVERLIEIVPRDRGPIAGFWPIGTEPDIRAALLAFAREGADVLLPSSGPPGSVLEFRSWDPDRPMIGGRFGVLEPGPDRPRLPPGVVLVPLLAFDARGHRLGYGAGYYDRTLEDLRRRGPVVALGVAFSGLEAERLPTDDRDQPLDGVVTERGMVRPARHGE